MLFSQINSIEFNDTETHALSQHSNDHSEFPNDELDELNVESLCEELLDDEEKIARNIVFHVHTSKVIGYSNQELKLHPPYISLPFCPPKLID
jgi:hypothetical protein